MDNKEILRENPLYKKIEETLETYKERDPTWQEIMSALTKTDESGNYMSVIGAFTAYFDDQGFARKLERLRTNGMEKTPKITMEQVYVERDPENKAMLNITYVSFENPDNPVVVNVEQVKEQYSVMDPGEYVAFSFEFNNKQRTEEKQLFNALEFYYQELNKYFDADDNMDAGFPIMTLNAVPIIYGGKYSVHMTNPFFWDFVNLEETKQGEVPKRALTVLFNFSDISFIVDEKANPEDTFMRCRSELASEWMREMQARRIEEERAAYKEKRETEISEMLGRTKHTFTTTKYGNKDQTTEDIEENRE